MAAIEQLIENGFALIVYPNQLGTATLVRIKPDQWEPFQDFIDVISDDQVVDVIRPITPQALDEAAARIDRKAKREGEYKDWDERMQKLGLSSQTTEDTNG